MLSTDFLLHFAENILSRVQTLWRSLVQSFERDSSVGEHSRSVALKALVPLKENIQQRFYGATQKIYDANTNKFNKQTLYPGSPFLSASHPGQFVEEINIEMQGVKFPFLQRCDGTTDPVTGFITCCPGHHVFDNRHQSMGVMIDEHTVPVCAPSVIQDSCC